MDIGYKSDKKIFILGVPYKQEFALVHLGSSAISMRSRIILSAKL